MYVRLHVRMQTCMHAHALVHACKYLLINEKSHVVWWHARHLFMSQKMFSYPDMCGTRLQIRSSTSIVRTHTYEHAAYVATCSRAGFYVVPCG